MPIAGLGLVIWATKSNGGVSSGSVETAAAPSSTTVFAFAVMSQFNSSKHKDAISKDLANKSALQLWEL